MWKKLAANYEGNVTFADFNCEPDHKECKEKNDVRGYPSFRLYRGNRLVDTFRPTYPRDYVIFEEWLNRKLKE